MNLIIISKILVIFVSISKSTSHTSNPDTKDENFWRLSYANLLNRITEINEQRLEALKKLNKLEAATVTYEYMLRDGSEVDSADDDPSLENTSLEDNSLEDTAPKDSNEPNLRCSRGLHKQIAHECAKACKKAFQLTCEEFTCRSSMKREMEKNCKKACKSRFYD